MVDHYFSKDSGSAFVPTQYVYIIDGMRLTFHAGSGVFSKSRLDACSKMLVLHADVKDGQHVLDLGCGAGPVGICLLKSNPALTCDFTDINRRAVQLTKKNLHANKISKARYRVYCGEGFAALPEDARYDVILLNPPQSAGRALCNALIEGARARLKQKGSLQVVARHNKGGREFEKFMRSVYARVETQSKHGGVRVYKGMKR